MSAKADSTEVTKYLALSLMVILLLYFFSTLFVPMFYGLFIAILLYPACKKLEQRGWPKTASIAFGLFLVIILFSALLFVLVLQVDAFLIDLPQIQIKLEPFLQKWQQWLTNNFNIAVTSQNEWLENSIKQFASNIGLLFRTTLNTVFILFLTPVFSALFLYNRSNFVLFVTKLFADNNIRIRAILNETVHTYFNFIKGMILVYIIVGILNSIGLIALGIRHAILFGFLTAIMTIIPYVGIFISALLPISVAWITKDSIWYPIGVTAVFSFVQYLEANVIFPRVVASQLNVSTWATLVAILIGNILWGVAGMILFIPFVGILKIVSDNIPELQLLNILLARSGLSTEKKD
ncbi:AI-2E family transporter [Segetibacter koreensis]|uniref:AI-2E family transporter n=1 Tax=Segetibacter koreensis TaxID=398037 RepID=UPI00035C88FE|nr:AI-2E family transporter [Segetibacter koreensis]